MRLPGVIILGLATGFLGCGAPAESPATDETRADASTGEELWWVGAAILQNLRPAENPGE